VKNLTSLDKAKLIARIAADKKGEDIILMDMANQSAMCDWFVIVSASSSRRINAISNGIQRTLSQDRIFPMHVEGRNSLYWALLDYEDVVVHVFYDEMRGFYGLERLWSDAPQMKM
jgi:ribosome-associated protein